MKNTVRVFFSILAVVYVFFLLICPVNATDLVTPPCAQGYQYDGSGPTGSEFRIYMPLPLNYNGRFIVWAHGFQDVTDELGIPENQLCLDGVCIPDIVVALGFGFAANSYRKTGLAVKEGMTDLADLVEKLTTYGSSPGSYCGLTAEPDKVYVVGASEGGLRPFWLSRARMYLMPHTPCAGRSVIFRWRSTTSEMRG